MTPKYSHPQVQASRATVDEGMAPLLELLWARGYQTQWSCQGARPIGEVSYQGGVATHSLFGSKCSDADIVFATFDDGARFLREAATGVQDVFGPQVWLNMMLQAMFADGGGLRARVVWRHALTPILIEMFQGMTPIQELR